VTHPQNDFTQGSMSKNILSIALPMTVAQVVNILYSLVDRMYIGHIPGVGHTSLTVLLAFLWGVDGVFVAEAVSQFVCGLLCFLTMYRTVYRPLSHGTHLVGVG